MKSLMIIGKQSRGALQLIAMALFFYCWPSSAFACNAYTFTMAAPLSPLQGGVQLVVATEVERITGLSIKSKKASTSEQYVSHYMKADSDLVVVTGSEPKGFVEATAALAGVRIIGETSGITLLLHPDTDQLFPKMADLLRRIMKGIERAGRERLATVTSGDAARKVLEGAP